MSPRIALYGGSFDPPHICHVLTATWVLCRSEVVSLRIIPVFQHPFGKELSPFEHRCAMVEGAMAHLGPLATVDRIEEVRGGASYTIDTVKALMKRDGDFQPVLIVGADVWPTRHEWHRWDELASLVEFQVIGRTGVPDPPDREPPCHMPDISSSDIRSRVGRGMPLSHLVPPSVEALIRTHGLYASPDDDAPTDATVV